MSKIKYKDESFYIKGRINVKPKRQVYYVANKIQGPRCEVCVEGKREIVKPKKTHNSSCHVALIRSKSGQIITKRNNNKILPKEGFIVDKKPSSTISYALEKTTEYLNKIKKEDGNLLIIDPYLFPTKSKDDYKELLEALLKTAGFNKLIVVTNEKNYDEELYNTILDNIGKKSEHVEVKFSEDYHDRFWISSNKKGFVMGTSLNGMGKKLTYIDLLKQEDVDYILKYVKDDLDIVL